MRNTRGLQVVLVLFSLAITLPSAVAQVVIATIPVGIGPSQVAVNSVTNKIYVVNSCGNDPTCGGVATER